MKKIQENQQIKFSGTQILWQINKSKINMDYSQKNKNNKTVKPD